MPCWCTHAATQTHARTHTATTTLRQQELELRIETQKQTLASRDESIKKLMEAMQSKGISSKMMEEERMEMERLRTRNIELEARMRHLESIAEIKDKDAYKVSERVKGRRRERQRDACVNVGE